MAFGSQRIIYISNLIFPIKSSGGGSAILYRHFSRFLKDGIKLVILNAFPSDSISSDAKFNEIRLSKQWFYPPLRKNLPAFLRIRTFLQYLFIKRRLQITKHDIVLGILGDYTNWLCYRIAKKHSLPLHFIFHDDDIFSENAQKVNLLSVEMYLEVLNYSSRIFVVSLEMESLLKEKGISEDKIVLLYPIPSVRKPSRITSPNNKAFFAGWLEPLRHTDILRSIVEACKINSIELSLITHLDKNSLSIKEDNVILQPFISNETQFNNFIQQFSFTLVFYSFDSTVETRMLTSFPSKFTEFSTLQIPVLIVAPSHSTLGKWAERNNWLAYVSTDKTNDISKMVAGLKTEEFWLKCREQAVLISKDQFDPEQIHLTLQKNLLKPQIN